MISIKYIIIYLLLFIFIYIISCKLPPKITENFDAIAELKEQIAKANASREEIDEPEPSLYSEEELQTQINQIQNEEANNENRFTLDVNLIGSGSLDTLKAQIKSLKEKIRKSSAEIKFLRNQV